MGTDGTTRKPSNALTKKNTISVGADAMFRSTRAMAGLNSGYQRPKTFWQGDYKHSTPIVAASWCFILVAGVGGFVYIRDVVIDQRKELVKKQREDFQTYKGMITKQTSPVDFHKVGTFNERVEKKDG